MKIEVDSSMRIAARQMVGEFQPVFRGQVLKTEVGLAANSEANLNHLLKEGLAVASIRVVEAGHVLVAFTGGESYLATGFAVGHAMDDPENGGKTTALARFMAKVFSGTTTKRWHEALVRCPHNPSKEGVLDLKLYPDAYLKPRISQ
jgi:hypothetical protein